MKFCLLAAVLLLAHAAASAQTVALGPPRLKPNLLIGGIGITVNTSTVNLALVQGGMSASKPVSMTTTVTGLGLADTLVVTAYFPTTSALTTSAGDIIPSSKVMGSCSTCIPTGFTGFAQTTSFGAGSSLLLLNQTTLLTVLGGSRTDTLNLAVDLTGSPQTPAGSYTGTLVIAAQIF